MSLTVTVKTQFAIPATFDAVQVTVFVPTGNKYGDAITFEPILQITVGLGLPLTFGKNDSARPHWPGALLVVTFPGQVMVGGVFVAEEFTVTLKAQVLVLPAASVAVHVTIVSPSGNIEPEGGAQLAVTPGQLSVAIGAGKLTFTLFAPAAASATTFAGQVIDGG